MNLTKKTIIALGALAIAGATYAQTTTSETAPAGLLGQRYAQIEFGAADISDYSKNQYGLGVGANLPLSANLDLSAGYGYSWIRGVGHVNGLSSSVTAYTSFGGAKPFVGGGVGYSWTRWSGGKDNQVNWGLTAGVEIPVGVVTITPRIVYSDDFEDSYASSQQLSYEVEANYWLNRSTAIFAEVGYVDFKHASDHAVTYGAGARFKF